MKKMEEGREFEIAGAAIQKRARSKSHTTCCVKRQQIHKVECVSSA